ncbi:restriction endonuclease subunit S [Halopseudomonas phragmitis]|uniref:Restriction endonuclease subunit S n=1 Tax=Halopseudomonas phragmitis TaxID=1931241 RepID=A0A1V0B139_9GAMM|nr:restriction endonuclease subunit S [Halopseudomonas phragmitis]AQZ93649.1 restriction endonuclease subunit S [Halopseudomonas phragmitis]
MSGKVKWPCKFPDRWTVLPSKRLFPESKERAPESDEQLSATQEYGVISQAEFMRLAGRRVVQLNQNLELRKRVEIGDFVISMRSFQGGLERAWAEGGIRSSYVVLRPRADLVPGYYQRLFKSVDYIQALQSTANFIRDGQDMNYQNFVLIDLPFPPVSEQLCIAAFLDHETARIDALIAEQQRLIELLKEKRQAVISHAVTKGLDPTVPMKDSGVEWLGEVPAHWVKKRLKNISPFITVGIVVNPSDYVADEGLPFLYGGEVKEGFIEVDKARKISPEHSRKNRKTMLEAGDIVTMRVGYPGLTAVVPPECAGGNCASVMLVKRGNYDSHWLCAVMNSRLVRQQVEVVQYGAAQKQFNIADAIEFWMFEPPIEEQTMIAEFIGGQSSVFNALMEESERSMLLLKERRSALISAAVTGKIDVRGWQPPASIQAPELAVAEAV